MSKIRPWHLFSACTIIWAVITVYNVVDGKYLLASLDFLAFLANGLAAIKLHEWEIDMSNSKPPWDDSEGNDMVPTNINPPLPVRAGDCLHTIHGYIIRETEKAILIEVQQVNETTLADAEVPGGNRNMWFPLSQVSTIHRDAGADGAYDYIRAKEWICKQKDLI